ncbi:MAG TPA: VOC family protein [Steroidobacteraceae bacterium]|jgi:catechol 2,3-dioxygenase-like lactoylglutathione lyase family enzyme|nr:VOC family protein [Steroidobacteraceae bacterium]
MSVTEIRYIGYGLPGVEAERTFYRDVWGLREAASQEGRYYLAAEGNDEPFVVRLRHAADRRVDVIALAADNRSAVDDLFARVKADHCRIIFAPKCLTDFGGGYGFRFFNKDGLPFEISCEYDRGPKRQLGPAEAIPQTISHIVLHSPDHKSMVQFFVDVLGFRVSDWLGDFMCFLRCNEWHHRMAILPGPPSLNHVAYDMANVDEMMRGVAKLKRNNIDIRWGPGRHTAGNNTFSYFVTPAGFAVEYTSELQQVDEASWKPRIYTPSQSVMDQWGTGVGGPHTMPRAEADKGLFQAAEV